MKARIEALCRMTNLGQPTEEIRPLIGGHLHRMFRVMTDRGQYAVKLLNPEIMERPDAWENFIRSEEIARMASSCLPACPAILFDNCPIIHQDGDWMVFPFLEGACVKNEDITPLMAHAVGNSLARLHSLTYIPAETVTDIHTGRWSEYRDRVVRENEADLIRWEHCRTRKAFGKNVLSHRDLEPKNVMWQGNTPVLIDWEAAGVCNAPEELFNAAYCFSRTADGVSEERFRSFFRGYFSVADVGDFSDTDWYAVSGCFYDLNDWLSYNLTRSHTGDTEEERILGREQVLWSMDELRRFDAHRENLAQWAFDFTEQG